ncbi:MAG: hypothetical protein V1853_02905 [bacterium]
MKIKKKRIIAFTPLLISLIIIALVIFPSWQKIEEQKATIDENRITQFDIEQLSQRTADLKSRSSELENKIVFLNEKLIDPAQALDFITQIEDLATLNKVELDVKTFDQPESNSNEGNLELRVTGYLTQTIQFFFALENFAWTVKADSIFLSRSISTSRETSPSNLSELVSLDIIGKAFWSNE